MKSGIYMVFGGFEVSQFVFPSNPTLTSLENLVLREFPGVGISHINTRFHSIGVAWNLELT